MDKKNKSRIPRSKGIAGTYFHIEDKSLNLSIEKTHYYLKKHVHIWAEENFNHEVIVRIKVEEGSVKAWVLVGGFALFDFVSNYGSFRSGIDIIVSDAKSFSDRVIDQFKTDEGVPDEAILRAERRLGVPGKIQRFFNKIDKLNKAGNQNDQLALTEKLKKEFLEILELLDDDRDQELFIKEVPIEISQQPNVPTPHPIPGVLNLDFIRHEDEWNA